MGNRPTLRLRLEACGSAAPLILAPLEGITTAPYRRVLFRRYGGFDGAVAPFIGTIRHSRRYTSHLKDLLPSRNNSEVPLIPQILGADPEGVRCVAAACANLGYTQVNWNIGCPIHNVVRKRRGAGILPHPAMIEAVLGETLRPGFPHLSVKLRTGLIDPSESLELLPLFNRYPLDFLILHPRTGKQMYSGAVDSDAYGRFQAGCGHSLLWSGDIQKPADLTRIADCFPGTAGWLLGRGVLMRPQLAREIRIEQTLPFPLCEALAFLSELGEEYLAEGSAPNWVLSTMKQHFAYLRKGCDEREAAAELWLRMRVLRRWEEFPTLVAEA